MGAAHDEAGVACRPLSAGDVSYPGRGVGVLTAQEILYPLDRRRLLVITHPPEIGGPDIPGDYISKIPAAQALAVSQRQALGAFEWWFKHPKDAHHFRTEPRRPCRCSLSQDLRPPSCAKLSRDGRQGFVMRTQLMLAWP
jgi:hypothetical protein